MSKSSFSSGGGKWKTPFSPAKHFPVPGQVSFAQAVPANTHGYPFLVGEFKISQG